MVVEFGGFSIDLVMIIRIALIVVVGIPAVSMLSRLTLRTCKSRLSPEVSLIISNIVYYVGFAYIVIALLQEFGFNIAALLGAAGVFGVAIGFASQTSISNIISGIFILLERAIKIGDMVKIADVIGIVSAIDLFSIKIRTFDNKLVRIPNETVLKQKVINITFFPERRIEWVISVKLQEDVERVMSIIKELLKANEFCADKPKPSLSISEITKTEIEPVIWTGILIKFWAKQKNVLKAKMALASAVKERFDKEKIEFLLRQIN